MGTASEPFVCVCVCVGGGGGGGGGGVSKYSASRRGFLQSPLVGITLCIYRNNPVTKLTIQFLRKIKLLLLFLKFSDCFEENQL